jgi:drug/metabolite transporter (DMT)-like permease
MAYRTLWAAAATVLWWASSPIGIHAALVAYAPEQLALMRFLIASVVAILIAGWAGIRRPQPKDLPVIILLGLFGITFHHLALNYGQRGISAGAASVLAQSSPLFTALIAMTVLREPSRLWIWAGILLGLTGASVVIIGEGRDVSVGPGGLLVLGAALSWAVYFVLQKPLLRRYRPVELTCYAVWAGTLPLLVFIPHLDQAIMAAPPTATFAVLYLGIFPSALAYLTWSIVLRDLPAVQASAFLYLAPPLAVAMGFIFFDQVPSPLAFCGGALTIAAVVAVNAGRTMRRPPAALDHAI